MVQLLSSTRNTHLNDVIITVLLPIGLIIYYPTYLDPHYDSRLIVSPDVMDTAVPFLLFSQSGNDARSKIHCIVTSAAS